MANVISEDYGRTEFAHCSNNETIIRLNTTLLCNVDFFSFLLMSFSIILEKQTVFQNNSVLIQQGTHVSCCMDSLRTV